MICGLGLLALIAVLSFATLGGHAAPATADAAGITLGVDVTTDGNSASQLGTIDDCKRVEVNDSVVVDLFVSDVGGLQGWELYFAFDSSHLTLTNQDTNYIVPGFPLTDNISDGLYFFGVAGTAPASGSGVLARLSFQAGSSGIANLGISTSPAWPVLSGQSGPIGDTSGDTYFDGTMTGARIAIGQDCPSGPVITNSPAPTLTGPPTATPSPSPTPTSSPTPVPTQTSPVTPGPSLTPTPTVTPSPSPTPAPTSSQTIIGDADCNGTVELPDVLTALMYASKLGPGNACQGRTDADCDGFVTANDVLRILRYLTGDAIPAPSGCLQIGSPAFG
jgi:hypothetical protein